jgi:hypothetical protein
MPMVRTEDLIDAQEVANIIGLAHRNAVSGYQRRYAEMPRPVVDLGPNRPLLWLRPEIESWARGRPPIRRGRPRRLDASQTAADTSNQSDANAPPAGGRRQRGGVEPRSGRKKSTSP